MVTATVGRVGVQALVPRTLGGPATERLRSAVGRPLADAVPGAFAVLEQVDPGAYWVLRSVHVDVRVPASEPDPARSAARIARAMATAVERVVHDGPSPDAVRFPSRAAYVAAYVGVVLDGGTGSWVFERLRSLGSLPPADAAVAAARAVSTELLEVVEELVAGGRWTRLLDSARVAEIGRLEAAVGRLAAPSASAAVRAAVEAVRASGPGGSPAGWRAPRPVEQRLRLLGEVLASGLAAPEAVAAVWAVEAAPPTNRVDDAPSADEGTSPARAATAAPLRRPADEQQDKEDTVESQTTDHLSALGAAAFLLAPDLDDLLPGVGAGADLAGTSRAAGDARALLLAAVLGRDTAANDAAVRLAAGAEPLRRPAADGDGDDGVDGDLRAFLEGLGSWTAALAADDVFGWVHPDDADWFAPLAARHEQLVVVARALLRRFAAHLPGFGHAGAAYLAERVLPLGGSVRLDEDAVVVELPRPPLHVLLALAGLDAFTFRCRWLDVPVVVVHEAD